MSHAHRDPDLKRLALMMVIYFLVTVGSLMYVIVSYPNAKTYLPVGGIDELPSLFDATPVYVPKEGGESLPELFESDPQTQAAMERALVPRSIWLLASLAGTLVFTYPIVTCYTATRHKRKNAMAMVETLYLLPIVVCAVIIVVQHSLAIAFGLAGIVAAVRFRNTLKEPSDAVFVFASIGVGVAAGVSEIGVAGIASMVFCLTLLVLSMTAGVPHRRPAKANKLGSDAGTTASRNLPR
jgi:hypothetical protein